jgi:hypothetical protein
MDNLPDLGISPTPEMNKITINTEGAHNLLQHLKPNKATGLEDIPTKFLKEVSIEISPLITFIFQASLDQGQIPSNWKQARVAPVFKKGDRGQPANYRPISLTSLLCKTLEHILHSTIITHLEHHNLLSDIQHGFQKKRSTENQLILTVQDLAAELDKGQQIYAVLLDFSKAFDKVPYRRLLLKLHHSGVRSNTLSWIADFLSGRSQEVVLEGKHSAQCKVTSGVPQDTVLGPLLFLAYINDMPPCVTSRGKLFADCILYRPIKTEAGATKLQEDIDALQNWESTWQMSFNPDKCEVLRITNKHNKIMANYYIHANNFKSSTTPNTSALPSPNISRGTIT